MHLGGPQLPLQVQMAAVGLFGQGLNQRRGMGDHPHLCALGCCVNQPSQGGQELWVQAAFRFVQHQQGWQPRAEECHGQEQIAQGSIGELRCFQRPQQPGLMHMQAKQSTIVLHAEVASRKGIIHCLLQAVAIPVFKDGLHRGR